MGLSLCVTRQIVFSRLVCFVLGSGPVSAVEFHTSFFNSFYFLIPFTGPSLRAKSTVPEQKKTVWLPYSRFVVRELVWMQPERDCLFSSASSSMVARLLPSMLLDLRKFEDAVIVSIDVKDAFLTVSQET